MENNKSEEKSYYYVVLKHNHDRHICINKETYDLIKNEMINNSSKPYSLIEFNECNNEHYYKYIKEIIKLRGYLPKSSKITVFLKNIVLLKEEIA